MSNSHLPAPSRHWALFLDVDGTLIEIAAHPDAVQPSRRVAPLLHALQTALEGAITLVSGRAIGALDRLVGPPRLPAAGLHGLERRDARGCWHRPPVAPEFEAAAAELDRFAAAHPGLMMEDKGAAVAIHYRAAPDAQAQVRERIESAARQLGEGYHVVAGKAVYELKPAAADKGRVIQTFMGEAPFHGRVPVFIGDDVSDEDGFASVNTLGGLSIRVGDGKTVAAYRLHSVGEVLTWLEWVAATLRA